MNLEFAWEVIKSCAKLLVKPRTSYSQYREDIFLSRILPEHGMYVDVGAYHPHVYSNTFSLYKRGWYGIAVDPNPACQMLFEFFRPRDTFLCAGVGEEGMMPYNTYTDGAYNNFGVPISSKRVKLKESFLTEIRRLSGITQGAQIDFLNIDVEGMELDVLKTVDWEQPPSVIAIETKEGSEARDFLERRGYTFLVQLGLTSIFKL